jgi:hypothetical protein
MTSEQLRIGFEEMAKAHGPTVSNIAKVKSVNETKAICILEDEDGQEIPDVRLRPVLNGNKSFIQIPKVGTFVLAVRIEDDDDWMVIACDEITKVVYYVGKTVFELSDKIQLKAGGENMANLIDALFTAIGNMVFTTDNGPTIKLINKAEFDNLKIKFNTLLK